jgi:cation transport ATPase
MGQMLIRQLDDAAIERLKMRARERRTSAEALAREAIHRVAAELSPEEKLNVVREMRAKYAAAVIPGVSQTSGVELIREDRDRDH